VSEAIKR
jgi:hypothetical protein